MKIELTESDYTIIGTLLGGIPGAVLFGVVGVIVGGISGAFIGDAIWMRRNHEDRV